jgi:hypothetical protein
MAAPVAKKRTGGRPKMSDDKKRTIILQVKINKSERAVIQKRANELTEGNISDLVRYMAILGKPREQDIK